MKELKKHPSDIELEQAVLGAILIEKDCLPNCIDRLNVNLFDSESHKIILKSILKLYDKKEPYDLFCVTQKLKEINKLEMVGGAYYVTSLTNKVNSAANTLHYIGILTELSIKRQLIRIFDKGLREVYEPTTLGLDFLNEIQSKINSITIQGSEEITVSSVLPQLLQDIEERKERRENGESVALSTGYPYLDRGFNGGLKGGKLYTIAARPAMGKTLLVGGIANNICKNGGKVLFFSLEMSAEELTERLVIGESEINGERIAIGNLSNDEIGKIYSSSFEGLANADNFFIEDKALVTVEEVIRKSRMFHHKHNIDCIIIDYMQLIEGTDKRENRQQQVTHIARMLKILAKETNLPVIGLAQLSRAVETRGGDKRPILSDLRESGAIEQDSDLVGFLYRGEYYDIPQDNYGSTKCRLDVDICKHRGGALTMVHLYADLSISKLSDWIPEEEEERHERN